MGRPCSRWLAKWALRRSYPSVMTRFIFPPLAQDEESGLLGGVAGSGGGLGEMTRRKREIIGLTNERDFPHLVELAVPPGGFRNAFLEFDAFQERRIPVHRGRSRHEADQFYIRFCFPDTATAEASAACVSCAVPSPPSWRGWPP